MAKLDGDGYFDMTPAKHQKIYFFTYTMEDHTLYNSRKIAIVGIDDITYIPHFSFDNSFTSKKKVGNHTFCFFLRKVLCCF